MKFSAFVMNWRGAVLEKSVEEAKEYGVARGDIVNCVKNVLTYSLNMVKFHRDSTIRG